MFNKLLFFTFTALTMISCHDLTDSSKKSINTSLKNEIPFTGMAISMAKIDLDKLEEDYSMDGISSKITKLLEEFLPIEDRKSETDSNSKSNKNLSIDGIRSKINKLKEDPIGELIEDFYIPKIDLGITELEDFSIDDRIFETDSISKSNKKLEDELTKLKKDLIGDIDLSSKSNKALSINDKEPETDPTITKNNKDLF